jgi:hypothetical protein
MLLGTLLDKLNDEAFAVETVLGLGDLGLVARVKNLAAEHGIGFGEVVTRTVHNFTANAGSDHWVQLMGTINRADDPGGAALKQMLEIALPQC